MRIELQDRVALAPHTDAWMRGIRYGRVTKIGRKYVTVVGETLAGTHPTVRLPLDAVSVVPSAAWLKDGA